MKDEIAIEYLKDMLAAAEANLHVPDMAEHAEALNMAIKALSIQPEDVIHITGRRKFVPEFDFDEVEEEQEMGEWISLDDFRGPYNEFGYKCSKCGEQNDYQDNYCPNCGARMEGEEK